MIDKLLNKHIANLRKLVIVFQKKHELPDYASFYSEKLAITDTLVFFGEHYLFTIDNILFDLSTNQPKGLILEWFDTDFKGINVNFKSYSMGHRSVKDLVKDAKTKLEITKKDFLNNLNNN